MKKLGIIGGLGPMATVYFLQLLTQMSDAATDQEHMELLLHSKPSIPDRTQYILGLSDKNPVYDMVEIGKNLKSQGADCIAIPCITAHYFHATLEKEIRIPVLHAIEDTCIYLKKRGIDAAGIMATDGTVQSGLFQAAMRRYGINPIVPKELQQKQVMHMIYDQIKTGKQGDPAILSEVSDSLRNMGAQVSLLGCTELSIFKRDFTLSAGYLDVMEVLARKAVLTCGRFNMAYDELITK